MKNFIFSSYTVNKNLANLVGFESALILEFLDLKKYFLGSDFALYPQEIALDLGFEEKYIENILENLITKGFILPSQEKANSYNLSDQILEIIKKTKLIDIISLNTCLYNYFGLKKAFVLQEALKCLKIQALALNDRSDLNIAININALNNLYPFITKEEFKKAILDLEYKDGFAVQKMANNGVFFLYFTKQNIQYFLSKGVNYKNL